MPSARVVAVAPGSPAATAGVVSGDEVVTVNGADLRDVIAYQFEADEPVVDLDLRRGGLERSVTVRKAAGAPLGIELESAVFDRVRTCDNHCPFCFVYQLPKGMRRSLYVKDDDYRLSFLYGNFTTLTRFTEADVERVVTEGLSPLYVSIHATDPEVRAGLLRNRRGATSLRWLALLLDAGIEVHGQIVVCPGVNDGPVLDDTLLGVMDRFPRLASIGLVPLGVSRHSEEPLMRAHTRAEAEAVLEAVVTWQRRYFDALGRRLAFAADEYYLLAQRRFPEADEYDGFPQMENGIGMARTFDGEVRARPGGPERRWIGSTFGLLRLGRRRARLRIPRRAVGCRRARPASGMSSTPTEGAADGAVASVALITGEMGEQVLTPLLPALSARAGAPVRALAVRNEFFGGNVGVTGLLTGADLAAALRDEPDGERYMLPDVVLSGGRFLDGLLPSELPRAVEVVGTDGTSLVEALTSRAAA